MNGAWIAAFVTLWVLVIILVIIVLGLVRRQAEVFDAARAARRTPSGPRGAAVGSTITMFTGRDASGRTVRPADISWPAVFLFISDECEFCQNLLNEVRGLARPLGPVPLVLASAADLTHPDDVQGINAQVVTGAQVTDAFLVNASPYAFAVDAARTVVASGVVNRLEQLRDFAARIEQASAADAGRAHSVSGAQST